MANPPSLPDSTRSRYQNGHGPSSDRFSAAPHSTKSAPSFLAPFLGAFAAVIFLAVFGVALYFGIGALQNTPSSGKNKNLLEDVAAWKVGTQPAKQLEASDQPDIGWWARNFDLPKPEPVLAFLNKQGLQVSRIEPAHYQDTKDETVITYHVHAEVPTQLLRLQKISWQPTDPDLARFAHVLVLNEGLPPGQLWNTQAPTVVAEAGTKLDFAWQIHYDKNFNAVTTDRMPLSEGLYVQQEVSQFQAEADNAVAKLRSQVQQINAQVEANTQARLAQVPTDPPKPEKISDKWGGDGSGEPTKSGERIGGGTLAGAAGGAAFGAAAGDAGLGAGIGAGVGLLGGVIYDAVSKDNDKKRYQRKVAAQNAENLSEWRAQIKALKQHRNEIKQEGLAERDRALSDLANRIAAAKGHLDSASPEIAPVSPAPVTATSVQPTSDQPSGPISRP